jgi:hypothetical protein
MTHQDTGTPRWVKIFAAAGAVLAVLIVVLLLYMQTLTGLAVQARALSPGADPTVLRDPSPTVHGVGALLALLVATVLSVYKPRGLTSHGRWTRLATLGAPGR